MPRDGREIFIPRINLVKQMKHPGDLQHIQILLINKCVLS